MNIYKKITLGSLLIALISSPVGSTQANNPVKPTPTQWAFLATQILFSTAAFVYFQKKANKNIKKVTKQVNEAIKPTTQEGKDAVNRLDTIIWALCWTFGGAALLYGCSYKSTKLGTQDKPASINDKVWEFFGSEQPKNPAGINFLFPDQA